MCHVIMRLGFIFVYINQFYIFQVTIIETFGQKKEDVSSRSSQRPIRCVRVHARLLCARLFLRNPGDWGRTPKGSHLENNEQQIWRVSNQRFPWHPRHRVGLRLDCTLTWENKANGSCCVQEERCVSATARCCALSNINVRLISPQDSNVRAHTSTHTHGRITMKGSDGKV